MINIVYSVSFCKFGVNCTAKNSFEYLANCIQHYQANHRPSFLYWNEDPVGIGFRKLNLHWCIGSKWHSQAERGGFQPPGSQNLSRLAEFPQLQLV